MTDLDLTDPVLEQFLGERLAAAGVWPTAGYGDGITALRVVEQSAARISLVGRIYPIDQGMEVFWIDLEPALGRDDDVRDRVRWTLHYGVNGSARDVADAYDSCDRADQVDWGLTLAGHAVVRDGLLIAEP